MDQEDSLMRHEVENTDILGTLPQGLMCRMTSDATVVWKMSVHVHTKPIVWWIVFILFLKPMTFGINPSVHALCAMLVVALTSCRGE